MPLRSRVYRAVVPPLAMLVLAACGAGVPASSRAPSAVVGDNPVASSSTAPAPPPRPALPDGSRTLFPQHRLVGYCGTPGAPALGALRGNLTKVTKDMLKLAANYAGDREILPVFELITVVVMAAAGKDNTWRRRVPDTVVDDYLKAARAAKGILLLNIQPGHSDFLTEVKAYEKYLKMPDVGVALDPEWAMWKEGQVPGSVYGRTTGEAINDVGAYLADLVKEGDLPEKALVFHQVNVHVLKDEDTITTHPGVIVIKSVDGRGYTGAKILTYHSLVDHMSPDIHAGFKLFFDEDVTIGGRLMGPKEVMALTPLPEYVLYE